MGFYAMALIFWIAFLWLAALFGFETPEVVADRGEKFAFYRVHRELFCNREHIPPGHCDKAFKDSAAEQYAIRSWVEMKMARDKEEQEKAPLWGLVSAFKWPSERR